MWGLYEQIFDVVTDEEHFVIKSKGMMLQPYGSYYVLSLKFFDWDCVNKISDSTLSTGRGSFGNLMRCVG